jgi:DNA-directed RNA polymerase subunit beta'
MDDMRIPDSKGTILEAAQKRVMETESQYNDGLITLREKYNKVVIFGRR